LTDEPPAVKLPDELRGMFHLARNAFVYYETETGTWDEESMIRFRDVLYDLVQASEATAPDSQQHYIGAAMEHLALTISEPLQRRAEMLLLEVGRPAKLFRVFRMTHNYGRGATQTDISDIRRRIEHYLAEGRKAKVRLTLSDAQIAYDSFREAYKGAVLLQETLKSRKLKPPIAALLWGLSIVLAAIIGAIITRLLS
jgi:hypothetical protein